ncbi:MAG: cell wall hydrolase [Rhodospirillales bacterium]
MIGFFRFVCIVALIAAPLAARAVEHVGSWGEYELDCIARAVYFEAGGEPLVGQIGVAQVIMNRVKDRRFADSPCGVIADGFYFPRNVPITQAARWDQAQRIAADVADGRNLDARFARALYFHGLKEYPSWMKIKRPLVTIGGHIFYGD